MMGPTCIECDDRYPEGAVHESCAYARIHEESVPFDRVPTVELEVMPS